MNLKVKLVAAFALILLIFTLAGLYSVLNLHKQVTAIKELTTNDLPLVEKIAATKLLMGQYRQAEKDILLNIGLPDKQRGYLEKLNKILELTQTNLTTLIVKTAADAELPVEVRGMPSAVLEGLNTYDGVVQPVMVKVMGDQDSQRMSAVEANVHLTKFKDSFYQAQALMDKLDKYTSTMIQTNQKDLAELSRRTEVILIASIVLTVLMGIILSLFLIRNVMHQLGADPGYLYEVSNSIADGDISVKFIPQKKVGGVYAAVQRMVNNMREQLYFSQGVMHGVVAPFTVISPNDTILYTNQAMLDLMDISGKPEDQVGKQSGELVFGVKGKETLATRALREKVTMFADSVVESRRGKARHVRISSAPFFDVKKELLGSVSIWLDKTDAMEAKCKAEHNAESMMAAATQLEKVVEVVGSALEEISAQVEQSSRGTEVQSIRVGEAATAMEEMNSTVLEVAKNASQAADSSDEARIKALEGGRIVAQVMASIDSVQAVSAIMKEDMGMLGKQAEGIGQIMNVISDIADQTNLLALNAAIEAARAGDAGRGFAVVADEVRKLAEKTMTATKEVGEAINSIQKATKKNLENVENAVTTVGQTTEFANKSGEALQEIVHLVEISTDQVRSIATASEEQSAASEEINRSIEEISHISNETASAMSHSVQAVGELATQAGTLRSLIERMKSGE